MADACITFSGLMLGYNRLPAAAARFWTVRLEPMCLNSIPFILNGNIFVTANYKATLLF